MSNLTAGTEASVGATAFPDHQTGVRLRLYGYQLDFFVEDPTRPTAMEVVMLSDLVLIRGLQQQSLKVDVKGGPPGTIGVCLCREGRIDVNYVKGMRTFVAGQACVLGDSAGVGDVFVHAGSRIDSIVFSKFNIESVMINTFSRTVNAEELHFSGGGVSDKIHNILCDLVDVAFGLHASKDYNLTTVLIPTISASIISVILVGASHSLSEMTSRIGRPRYTKRIQNVVAYIERNVSRADLSVREIARHTGMSQRSLQNLVAKETGMSPRELTSEVRLTVAREQLRDNHDRSVSVIANSCGFRSAAAFGRAYKVRFGHTPLSERK